MASPKSPNPATGLNHPDPEVSMNEVGSRRPDVPGFSQFRTPTRLTIVHAADPHVRLSPAIRVLAQTDTTAPPADVKYQKVIEGGELAKSGRRSPYTVGDWPALMAKHLAFRKKQTMVEITELQKAAALQGDAELEQLRKELDAELKIQTEIERSERISLQQDRARKKKR